MKKEQKIEGGGGGEEVKLPRQSEKMSPEETERYFPEVSTTVADFLSPESDSIVIAKSGKYAGLKFVVFEKRPNGKVLAALFIDAVSVPAVELDEKDLTTVGRADVSMAA